MIFLDFLTNMTCSPVYYLDASGKPQTMKGENARVFFRLFLQSGCHEQMMTFFNENSSPALLSDALDMIWLAVPEYHNKKLTAIYVLGPTMEHFVSDTELLHLLAKSGLTEALQNQLKPILNHVQEMWNIQLLKLADNLYYTLNHSHQAATDCRKNIPQFPDQPKHFGEKITEPSFRNLQLEQMIIDGILNGMDASEIQKKFNLLPALEGPYRNFATFRLCQDDFIGMVTLISYMVASNGVPQEEAFLLSNYYIQMAELSKNDRQIHRLWEPMENAFIELIRHYKIRKTYSPPVEACRFYILERLTEKIVLKDMAAALFYNPYYLSSLFKKETGMTVNEFIISERIGRAKFLLEYSNSSLMEISNMLCFCDQSSFGVAFRKYTGTTPKKYRENIIKKKK